MDKPKAADQLIGQFRAGDESAARELFARYARRLSALAERHLSERLRTRIDSEDVVQSVLLTFFKRSARGEFQIDSTAQIWQLLSRITLQRVRAKARYHTAEMRDVRAEDHPAEGAAAASPAHEPDPSDAAALVEAMELLVAGLPPMYCQVLEMRLQGYAPDEIGQRLSVSRRTVYRALELLKERLARQATEPAARSPD